MSLIDDSCEIIASKLITDATDSSHSTIAARSSWRAAICLTLWWLARIIIAPIVVRYSQTAIFHAVSTRVISSQPDGSSTPAATPITIARLRCGRLRTKPWKGSGIFMGLASVVVDTAS